MNSKQLLSIAAIIILASTVLLVTSTVEGAVSLKLPSTAVTIVAVNGTQAFFNTTLSGIGSGFDVSNGTYFGWCVDISTQMTFSVEHSVKLHSSLNPDVLTGENWTMVNYVLNHKQGDREDIQDAIWYFINLDDEYEPKTPTGWAMVADAEANGTAFVPAAGQKIAVIANPTIPFPQQGTIQISIIEVTMPSEAAPTPTPPGTTPTPTPTSEPGSSPTPTPSQEPGQTSPTPDTTDGSGDSNGGTGNEALVVFGIILALVAIVIVVLLILSKRKK